ncbi:MAG TPA: ribonuclease H-like domain-containing protein [Candidatus Acidoferrales bacterium]|jgi:hypothetical protein|nr:ribonuclease H-like domain-containing protein [Candidatus Acidoferrales bacterium]
MSATIPDRFSRLKALQRPPALAIAKSTPQQTWHGSSTGWFPELPAGADRLAELLAATPRSNQYGEHLALRRWFSEAIGSENPEGPFDRDALRLLVPGAPDCVCDPRQWLFLDTETTGISGGTGTYPFLIGIAWYDAGGLEVEQFFMREHSEEHSVLTALSERMAERRVLVTFNGKSFDWPLLETRYNMTRKIRVPSPRAHLDFLHPARNLWRLRLGSARLQELERHVLGWNRGADIISEFIPQIYFDYLRGGSPDPLVPIFHHNQMDLRGLAGLASRTLAILSNPEQHGQDALELFGVSRICERRGETARAKHLYARSIAADLPEDTSLAAHRFLARIAKRDGDHALACELWEKLIAEKTASTSREGFEAFEQLAIHYERRARTPQRAADLITRALINLRRANRLGLISAGAYVQKRARFERRLARLQRNLHATLLDPTQ